MVRLCGINWKAKRGDDPRIATAQTYRELHPDVSIQWEQLPWGEFTDVQRRELAARSGYDDLVVYVTFYGEVGGVDWL